MIYKGKIRHLRPAELGIVLKNGLLVTVVDDKGLYCGHGYIDGINPGESYHNTEYVWVDSKHDKDDESEHKFNYEVHINELIIPTVVDKVTNERHIIQHPKSFKNIYTYKKLELRIPRIIDTYFATYPDGGAMILDSINDQALHLVSTFSQFIHDSELIHKDIKFVDEALSIGKSMAIEYVKGRMMLAEELRITHGLQLKEFLGIDVIEHAGVLIDAISEVQSV